MSRTDLESTIQDFKNNNNDVAPELLEAKIATLRSIYAREYHCSVCLSRMSMSRHFVMPTGCCHAFCAVCIQKVSEATPQGEFAKCPSCRTPIDDITTVFPGKGDENEEVSTVQGRLNVIRKDIVKRRYKMRKIEVRLHRAREQISKLEALIPVEQAELETERRMLTTLQRAMSVLEKENVKSH